MHVIKDLSQIPSLSQPAAITIGCFDGMHLGHQLLINRAKELAGKEGSVIVFTFSNHPSQILKTRVPAPLLCSLEHKLMLLKKAGVDLVYLQEFTVEFSRQPYDRFLKEIKHNLPFSFFVLGKGASFGKDKEGDEKHVKKLGKTLKFTPEYVKKIGLTKQPVSSGFIRHLIDGGNLHYAEQHLGRPYSVYGVLKGNELDISGLCVPPDGSYTMTLKIKKEEIKTTGHIDKERGALILDGVENTTAHIEAIFHEYQGKN